YGSVSSPLAGLQDRVQQGGGRGAHIQRLEVPADRQRDEVVARRRDPRAEAPPLGAEDQHDAALVVGPVVGRRRGGIGAVAPAARRLGGGEEVGQVADARDRQVLDGAGGGLAHRRRDLGRAPLG